MHAKNRQGLSRGIYLIPSLMTLAALGFGFFSIIYTLRSLLFGREEFQWAVFSIIIASFLDSLDGRLARYWKVETEFGLQLDSLSDVVSFGVAPAILVYGVSLIHLDRLGWAATFLFLACAAIRLARFNVMVEKGHSRKYFKGLPSPAAAGGMAVSLLVLSDYLSGVFLDYPILVITICLGLLMVSNVRFRSFKDLHLKEHRLQVFLVGMLGLLFVFSFKERALFILFLIYLIGGIIEEIVLWKRRRRSDSKVPFLPFGDRE